MSIWVNSAARGTETTSSHRMARITNHPSFLVPCPNCESSIEHSLAWMKGRKDFEFYCDSCGHRDTIEAATVPGLSEALKDLEP